MKFCLIIANITLSYDSFNVWSKMFVHRFSKVSQKVLVLRIQRICAQLSTCYIVHTYYRRHIRTSAIDLKLSIGILK